MSISAEMNYRSSAYVRRMQTIVIKYLQVICIGILFENVKCEHLRFDASQQEDIQLNREIGCMAACMVENRTSVCMKSCIQK